MAINNMSHKNGKLYCIRNTVDNDIYVGSTAQLVSKLMVHHRSAAANNTHMKLYIKIEGDWCRTFLY